MNKFKEAVPYVVLGVLLVLAARGSAAIAYAADVAFGLILAFNAFQQIEASKTYKAQLPEEVRKQIQELNLRLTALEYEKQRRGF